MFSYPTRFPLANVLYPYSHNFHTKHLLGLIHWAGLTGYAWALAYSLWDDVVDCTLYNRKQLWCSPSIQWERKMERICVMLIEQLLYRHTNEMNGILGKAPALQGYIYTGLVTIWTTEMNFVMKCPRWRIDQWTCSLKSSVLPLYHDC